MRTPERRPARPTGGSDRGGREVLAQHRDGSFFIRLIAVLLAFTVVPLADIFLFIYLGHLIGNSLVLALTVAAGAVGALAAADQLGRCLARLRTSLEPGRHPVPELVDLAAVLAGSALLLTPGFITDLFGFALMVPVVRRAVAGLVAHGLGPRTRGVLDRLVSLQSLKIR